MLVTVKMDYIPAKPAIFLNILHWIPGLDFAFSLVMAIYLQIMIIRRDTARIKAQSIPSNRD